MPTASASDEPPSRRRSRLAAGSGAGPGSRVQPRARLGSVAVFVIIAGVLTAVLVAYGRARWPHALPVGSDNDEYQLVGQALARFDTPLVAGVEGTKYPLGYPAVLALLTWLGIPVAPGALVVNLIALIGTVGTVAYIAGRSGPGQPRGRRASGAGRPATTPRVDPGAALAAGAVVATSVSVWNDMFSIMPELLLLWVVTAMLAVVAGVSGWPAVADWPGLRGDPVAPSDAERDDPVGGTSSALWGPVVALSVLAVVAVLLKTLAILIVVGGASVVWATTRLYRGRRPTFAERPTARWLLPAAAGIATVLAGMLVVRDLPEHTTGYLATFPLADPDDASQGRLGVVGLVGRSIRDVPDTLADIGRAMMLIDAGRNVAVVVALVGLTIGTIGAFRSRRGGPLGPFVLGMSLAYAGGMAAWPYHSSRFGLPLVPVAALGVGWVVREAGERISRHRLAQVTSPSAGSASAAGSAADHSSTAVPLGSASAAGVSLGLAALVVLGLVTTSWGAVNDRGERAREGLARHHAALADLDGWARSSLDDDAVLVSFDYREIARLLDRDVAPLAYTTDADALLDQADGANRLVVMDIYRKRSRQAEILLETHADRFTLVFDADDVRVYHIAPG